MLLLLFGATRCPAVLKFWGANPFFLRACDAGLGLQYVQYCESPCRFCYTARCTHNPCAQPCTRKFSQGANREQTTVRKRSRLRANASAPSQFSRAPSPHECMNPTWLLSFQYIPLETNCQKERHCIACRHKYSDIQIDRYLSKKFSTP